MGPKVTPLLTTHSGALTDFVIHTVDGYFRYLICRVLAAEQMEVGGLKVLNYRPGPMGTDMARELRSQAEYERDVESGRLVDPKISAEKCVRLVVTGRFESGAHVEFSDSKNTVA